MEDITIAIQHKDIPESQLHEPKGVSTAAMGTVITADGAGSSSFVDPLTLNNIAFNGVATASSFVNQVITVGDIPTKVTFTEVNNSSTMTFDLNGDITIEEAGVYELTGTYNFGRTSSAAQAIVFANSYLNGVPAPGGMVGAVLDDSDTSRPVTFSLFREYNQGDVLSIYIMVDSLHNLNGGLTAIPATNPIWGDVPSIRITARRVRGAITDDS